MTILAPGPEKALYFAVAVLAPKLWQAVGYLWRQAFSKGKQQGLTLARAKEFVEIVEALKRDFAENNHRHDETLRAIAELRTFTLKEVQDLYDALGANNDIQNDRFHEHYKEFAALKAKVAAYTGDYNGGTAH